MTKKQKLLRICGILFLVENSAIILFFGIFYLSIGMIENDAPAFITEMNEKVLNEGDGEWLWRHFSKTNRQFYKKPDILSMASALATGNPNYLGYEIVSHTDHKSRSLRGEPFINSYYLVKLQYPDYQLLVEYRIAKEGGLWWIKQFNIKNRLTQMSGETPANTSR